MVNENSWNDWLEPAALEGLTTNPKHFELVLPALEWLLTELRRQVGDQIPGVTIRVIAMERFGTYPVIAFRTENPAEVRYVKKLLDSAAERILNEATLLDFLRFAGAATRSWSKTAAELLQETP